MCPEITHIPTAIVGGGVVGLNIAKALSQRNEFLDEIYIFEKSQHLGDAQSGRNSGVLHASIYYPNDSLKAKFCLEGNLLTKQYAKEKNIPYDECGKLIIATNNDEIKTLEFYLDRAIKNGVNESISDNNQKIRIISGNEAKKLSPNVNAIAAIYSPSTGIIDAATYLQRLKNDFDPNKEKILMENEIVNVNPEKDYVDFEVKLRDGSIETYRTDLFINAAGLYADKIAKMVNPNSSYEIEPVRGEYYTFNVNRDDISINNMNIYPAPEIYHVNGNKHVTVGVHLTPTFETDLKGDVKVGRTVIVGPYANPALNKEDYSNNNRIGKEKFFEKINKYFPNIKMDDLQMGDIGIRAKLKDHYDIVIEKDQKYSNCINIIGSDSPFLTGAAAIGPYVNKLI